jgi:hypothetical protein
MAVATISSYSHTGLCFTIIRYVLRFINCFYDVADMFLVGSRYERLFVYKVFSSSAFFSSHHLRSQQPRSSARIPNRRPRFLLGHLGGFPGVRVLPPSPLLLPVFSAQCQFPKASNHWVRGEHTAVMSFSRLHSSSGLIRRELLRPWLILSLLVGPSLPARVSASLAQGGHSQPAHLHGTPPLVASTFLCCLRWRLRISKL